MSRQLESSVEKVRNLQISGKCVVCEKSALTDSVGSDRGWLPCCFECYESGALDKWCKENNHNFEK